MRVLSFRNALGAAILSLGLGLGIMLLFSNKPMLLLQAFVTLPFTQALFFGNMVEKAGLILLCAIGFSIAFRSGAFNLGGEGQFAVGALSATVFALAYPSLPFPSGIIAGGFVGLLSAGILGMIIAFLKFKVQISEVISSFLLSLAVLPLIDFAVSGPLRDGASNLLSTNTIAPSFFLPHILSPSNLSFGVFGSVAVAILTWIVLRHSQFGYDNRLIASNLEFAKTQGVPIGRRMFLTMGLSAGFQGLAGATAVFGTYHSTFTGISGGIGWSGIAAALLAKTHPIAAIFGSLALAYIDTGTKAAMVYNDLNLEMSGIMQGVFFLFITAKTFGRRNG